MIKDFPNPKEYETLGIEWLAQSFQILYEYGQETEGVDLADSEKWKKADWHFHRGKLSTSLVLVHQSIESILKSKICNVSPLLLIEDNRRDWPTLPDNRDKSFNDLYTIGADALLKTYCAVSSRDNKSLVDLFEELRVKRNQIVHGLYKKILEPIYLLDLQFRASKILFDKSLWKILKEEEEKHPLFEASTQYDEIYLSHLHGRLEFIHAIFGQKKFKEWLGVEGRPYLCPHCSREVQDWDFKTSYLTPNKPTSNHIECLLCDQRFNVRRKECRLCKGNVIIKKEEDKICLSCGEEN